MNQRTMAFWAYDNPPFLGGEVTEVNRVGAVATVEYGPGNYFRPVFLLPYDVGVGVRQHLKEIQEACDREIAEAHKRRDEAVAVLVASYLPVTRRG